MSVASLLCCCVLGLSLSVNGLPSLASASAEQRSADEVALRTLGEAFFNTWAAKDLDGWLRLWSAHAPELEARKKATSELFAGSARITLTSLIVRRVGLAGARAWVRVELDARVIDAQTGKEKPGFGKAQRTLACAKESDGWKVVRELAGFDALAEAMVAALNDQERTAILDSLDSQSLAAIALNRVGSLYQRQGKYELALSYYQRAREAGEAANNKAQQGLALQRIGEVRQVTGQYNEAIEAYRQSLALAEAMNVKTATADLHGRLASLHILLGRYDSALAEVEQGLAIASGLEDKYWLALTMTRKGNVYLESGRYADGIEMYQQALALAEKGRATDVMDSCLNNLGISYRIQGDFQRALEFLQKSLKLAESGGDRLGIAQTLNSIGIVYQKQGDLAVALDYFNRSLSLLGEARGRTTMDVLQNLGMVAMLQENYSPALQLYEKALSLAEASQDQPARARALLGLGEVYYRLQKYDEAAARYQQVLDFKVRSVNNEPPFALLSLGKVRYRQGEYARALELAGRAEAINQEFENKEMTAALGDLKGKVYAAMNDPRKARQAFDEGIAALESLRAGVTGDERGQSLFFENRLSAYRGALSLLIRQGQPADALVYAERSKARVILDVLRNGRVDIHRAMTAEERQEEDKLKGILLGLNRQLTQARQSTAQPPPALAEVRGQIEKARLNYEVFLGAVYAAHPGLKVQRGEAPVIQASELAGLLPDARTALLEYSVTEDKTYLFVVTKSSDKAESGVKVFTLPVKREELSRQIEAFRQQLAGRDLGFRAAASRLTDLLLKPAQAQLAGKTNLVIVPDDKLWDLPFQALLDEKQRFLLEDAAVAYAPSLTVLREMRKHEPRASASPIAILALGNPLLGKETVQRTTLALRGEQLSPLPGAEAEVKALGQLYGLAHSKIYVGAEAREDRAKAEAVDARVLHFATHGVLNNAAPLYSYLVLTQGAATEDGLLEARELMQLDLKADLAVLSACETARGRFGAGEGMIGLTWALFVAGVPSTVVSQWKVESAATRDLMLDFHRALNAPSAARQKPTKTEALRQAALKLMKKPATSHPFYWAGFVLIGDGR